MNGMPMSPPATSVSQTSALSCGVARTVLASRNSVSVTPSAMPRNENGVSSRATARERAAAVTGVGRRFLTLLRGACALAVFCGAGAGADAAFACTMAGALAGATTGALTTGVGSGVMRPSKLVSALAGVASVPASAAAAAQVRKAVRDARFIEWTSISQ
ncbi:hypothetical protein PT2222_170072 [Paraburkholderia tropica]